MRFEYTTRNAALHLSKEEDIRRRGGHEAIVFVSEAPGTFSHAHGQAHDRPKLRNERATVLFS
jgi:hypothetical protein